MLWIPFATAIAAILAYNVVILPLTKFLRLNRSMRDAFVASLYKLCWSSLDGKVQVHLQSANDEHLKLEAPALIICNHQSWVDYLVFICIANKGIFGPFMLKFLVWQSLIALPNLRVLWKRYKSEENWALSDNQFMRQLSGKNNGSDLIVLFPEVNQFSASLHEKHRLICEISGAPIFRNLLYPRFTAFRQAARLLNMEFGVRNLYDFTLKYDNDSVPTLWDVFLGKSIDVTIKISKFDIHKLHVEDNKYMDRWLENRWIFKDKLLRKLSKKHGL